MKDLSKEHVEYAVSYFVSVCQSRDIKQTELERISGVNQSTISKIIHPQDDGEKYTPSEDVLQKLFQALGFKLANILNESDRLTDEIAGYLATPLTGLSVKEDEEVRTVVHTIRRVATEDQFATPCFAAHCPGDHTHPTQHAPIPPSQVYATDRPRPSIH